MELFIVAIVLILVTWWVLEYRRHISFRDNIPIRIHVNGTRGKSSVTRLIAGALREGGIRTVAKTTGTLPRFIFPDGSEEPIIRLGSANILEQKTIICRAAQLGAKALVIECMALQPEYQEISEQKMINSTVGVITNARPDHLEVMGPTEDDVVDALSGTIKPRGICFTSEKERFKRLKDNAENMGAKLFLADDTSITDEDLEGFSYIEHRENVAITLAVAGHYGIPRDIALRGMHKCEPDFGALKVYKIDFFGKKTLFYNGFAANDPESTSTLWDKLGFQPNKDEPIIVIVNNRADRPNRTVQLAEMLEEHIDANYFILVGTNTKLLFEKIIRTGMDVTDVFDMGDNTPDEVFERCMELTPRNSKIIGLGNIGGIGRDLLTYIEARSKNENNHSEKDRG